MTGRRGSVSIILILLLVLVTVVSAWMMLAAGAGNALALGSGNAGRSKASAEAIGRLTEDIRGSLRILMPQTGTKSDALLLFGAAGMHVGYYLECLTGGGSVLNRMVIDPETGVVQEVTVVPGVRSLNFFGLDARMPGAGPEMVQIEIEFETVGDSGWLPPSSNRLSLRVSLRAPWWKLVTR